MLTVRLKKWKRSQNNGDAWKEANVRWMERKWAKPQEVINEKNINFKESQYFPFFSVFSSLKLTVLCREKHTQTHKHEAITNCWAEND